MPPTITTFTQITPTVIALYFYDLSKISFMEAYSGWFDLLIACVGLGDGPFHERMGFANSFL
jgi:hypothetical protein